MNNSEIQKNVQNDKITGLSQFIQVLGFINIFYWLINSDWI